MQRFFFLLYVSVFSFLFSFFLLKTSLKKKKKKQRSLDIDESVGEEAYYIVGLAFETTGQLDRALSSYREGRKVNFDLIIFRDIDRNRNRHLKSKKKKKKKKN